MILHGTAPDTIEITNLPGSMSKEPVVGDEGIHFQAYVDLLRLPGEHLRQRPRVFLDQVPSFSPYNCMVVTTEIKP
jgi:hypothetical protein